MHSGSKLQNTVLYIYYAHIHSDKLLYGNRLYDHRYKTIAHTGWLSNDLNVIFDIDISFSSERKPIVV